MKEKEQKESYLEEMNAVNQHSLLCNDELFIKDLMAIVDDTMRVDEEES